MEQTTVRIQENMLVSINEYAENMGVSQSEAIRDLLGKGLEYDSLEVEKENLERKLAEVNSKNQDIELIKEKVENQEKRINTPFFIRWYRYFKSK